MVAGVSYRLGSTLRLGDVNGLVCSVKDNCELIVEGEKHGFEFN
jgi:hypothetical protein